MKTLILMLISFVVLVAGCAPIQKQNIYEVTSQNGLPVDIDTKQIIGVFSNGTNCIVFFKSGMKLLARNCDQLRNEWKRVNK